MKKEKELVPKELESKPPVKDVSKDIKKLSDRIQQLEGQKGLGI